MTRRAPVWLAGAPLLLALCACETTPEKAREKLAERRIPFERSEFVQRAGTAPLETLELFVRGGMEPDVKADAGPNRDDVTALMVAAEAGREDVVRWLLKAGARVDARTRQDDTALHYASIGCRAELVTLLLLSGADVNEANRRGETALILSIPGTWPAQAPPCAADCVNRLLGAGAQIDHRARDLDTTLHRAIGREQLALVRLLLLRHGNPDLAGGSQNDSPLHHAVRKDAVEIVQALLRAGADRSDPTLLTWPSGTPRGSAVREAIESAGAASRAVAPAAALTRGK